ncbi:C6 zinc finger domain protein [Cordyceps militaris CM01]|uniref:C6 zinc finger domain protein n=1 Tax=Cordyceps militaris (strain CM01) TaxID=983644 RepID=G3JQ85_CORMM|nr:C6 zinc finger domain protein [Cordyceps militaris CM01]EGX89336.1 C6 zinc finger domain protein [Cordyceps militaris CM01]
MIRAVERMRLGLVKKNAIRTDYRRAGMAAETCGSHGAKYQLVDPMDGSWVSGASNCILRRVPQPSECEGRDSPTAGVQGLCGLLCLVERERHDDCGVETKCSTSMKAGGDGGVNTRRSKALDVLGKLDAIRKYSCRSFGDGWWCKRQPTGPFAVLTVVIGITITCLPEYHDIPHRDLKPQAARSFTIAQAGPPILARSSQTTLSWLLRCHGMHGTIRGQRCILCLQRPAFIPTYLGSDGYYFNSDTPRPEVSLSFMPFHTTMSAVLPAAASFAQALHALHHAHDPRAAIAPPQPGALAAGADTSSLSPTDAAALGPRPGKRPAARGTSFYPRKRANTACQVCRARKTKCDNSKPSCSYCLSVGATCIQSPADLSSFDPASLKILDRLDDLERLFRESATSTTASNLNSVDPASNAWHPPDITRRMSSNSHGRPKEIEPFTKGDGPGLGSILPLRVDHVLQWPLFNEQGQHEPLYRLPPAAISTPSAAPSALAGLVDMESYNIYQLLDRFFLYIHCKNPILDETSTRRLVGNAFLNGIDWSPASCLAMVICALGSVATPFGNSHEVKPGSQAYQDSQVFFHAAQKRIGIMLMSSDLVGAQCLFLSGVYMMMGAVHVRRLGIFSRFDGDGSSRHPGAGGILVSMESERELRNELDLPDFDIVHSGSTLYPPFFPAPPIPPAESPEGPDPETQRAKGAWLFYLAEISLRRLTSRLCSEVTKLRQKIPTNARFLEVLGEMITEYEGQARAWSDNLPTELSIQTPVAEDGISRSVLRGRLINLYEMFYWPFVMARLNAAASGVSVSDSVSHFSRTGLEMHVHQVHVNEPGFFHRHHGSLFMIRACTRSALVLVAAAKSGICMPANWQQSVYNVAGMLGYWEDEDSDLIQWRTTLEKELASILRR